MQRSVYSFIFSIHLCPGSHPLKIITMKCFLISIIRLLLLVSVVIYADHNNDRFNYRETVGTDYGPADWDEVTCGDVGDCLGWPDGWELGVGWELERNSCQWCPDTGNDCVAHRQSPINLERTDATAGHDPECYDFHWMAYHDGSCDWHDIVKNGYTIHSNNFKIERHSLQILQPIDRSGELQCLNARGESNFPRIDFPNGFGHDWHLSHTEVTVPSEHTQEGKRYDAEVHLAHFYSIEAARHLGKVVILLEADTSRERWDFLDKLICQWREVEEQNRDECGLESVPPYPGCRNPTREAGETDLPYVDPYPFIDCDSVENSQRICKPSSCCQSERSGSDYCQNDVYDRYGDEIVGSICWWCCPGKLLAPPEPIDNPIDLACSDYENHPEIRMERICRGCCDPVRSSTDHCHFVYNFFGEAMESICSHCCQPSKELAPPPPEHPIYPPIDCTTVTNPFRMCKQNSCCDSFPATNNKYCEEVYEDYADGIESICWYCCSEPIDIYESEITLNLPDTDQNRNLKIGSRRKELIKNISIPETQQKDGMKLSETISSRIRTSQMGAIDKRLDTEYTLNKDVADKEDKKRRKAQPKVQEKSRRVEETLTGDNYIDVPYSPYEWMREVKTEYYFRYEGTQMVPPCYGTVHYRVMKDPIRIHPDQLAELERLLAWRIAPKGSKFNECQRDTAGKDRAGSNGNAVDLNRPLQSYNYFHLKVFCECKDWESKFQEDRDWCELSDDERYGTHPYNYDSRGTY